MKNENPCSEDCHSRQYVGGCCDCGAAMENEYNAGWADGHAAGLAEVDALRTALAESRAREDRLRDAMGYVQSHTSPCVVWMREGKRCGVCVKCTVDRALAPAPASREGETSERSIWDNPKSNWTKPLPDRESFVDPNVSPEAIRDAARGRDPSGGERLCTRCGGRRFADNAAEAARRGDEDESRKRTG